MITEVQELEQDDDGRVAQAILENPRYSGKTYHAAMIHDDGVPRCGFHDEQLPLVDHDASPLDELIR